jgi:hypothetical protein
MLRRVALSDDLRRAAEAAAAFADENEHLEAVLAAEPSPGGRFYLCAFGVSGSEPQTRTWLVIDDRGAPVTARTLVREAVSIAALAEVAAENAGGGDLQELRGQLVQLRIIERPPGIDDAEEAALELECVVGTPPRIASPAYLDDVGAATRRLERALGEDASPFAAAMASATAAVDALTGEVESRYKRDLT